MSKSALRGSRFAMGLRRMGHPGFCGWGGFRRLRCGGSVLTGDWFAIATSRIAESNDGGSVAVGLFGAYAGDGLELGEASGAGEDDVMEDRVGEDDEGGFAGLGGFGFAPLAETAFEIFLG